MKQITLSIIIVVLVAVVGGVFAEPTQQLIGHPLPFCNFLPFIDGEPAIWPPRGGDRLSNTLMSSEIPLCLQVTPIATPTAPPIVPPTSTPIVFPTDEPDKCDTCTIGTKILICRYPGVHQETIHIACSAWPAHKGHGDYCGACK